MPASIFLAMNSILQSAFAHPSPAIWHRDGGPVGGDPLRVWFSTTSMVADADGFMMQSLKPSMTVFVADVVALDPARSSAKLEELFLNDGEDTLTVDGVTYEVADCVPDGLGKVTLELRSAQ